MEKAPLKKALEEYINNKIKKDGYWAKVKVGVLGIKKFKVGFVKIEKYPNGKTLITIDVNECDEGEYEKYFENLDIKL